MENIHNTPATYEQQKHYEKDPTAPESKPYSKTQQAANEMHQNRVMLYSLEHGEEKDNYGRIFMRDEVETALEEGWVESCPVHPKEKELGKMKSAKAKAEEPLLDVLRKEAEGMGIKVDKRWGAERIREEMAK